MNDCKIAPDTKYPPGSAATVYHDIDGNEVTLRQLIRLELKHLERQLAEKSEQLKRIVDAPLHDKRDQATHPLDAQGNPIFDRTMRPSEK